MYADLLLKSYEGHLSRFSSHLPPQGPLVAPGMQPHIGQTALAIAAPMALNFPGPGRPIAPPFGPTPGGVGMPPPGTFQHLLASMSTHAAKSPPQVKERESSPEPTPKASRSDLSGEVSGSGSLLPPDGDRRSSSIAALRMKAREYEMKLQLGNKYNGIVY